MPGEKRREWGGGAGGRGWLWTNRGTHVERGKNHTSSLLHSANTPSGPTVWNILSAKKNGKKDFLC